MRMRSIMAGAVIAAITISWALIPRSAVRAEEMLRYSCSAQVYEAFEKERLAAFTQATGIQVDLFVASSSSSVNRLMYGISDVASTSRGLHYPLVESGYVETAFCRDPMAVIVNDQCPVTGISWEQLVAIFSGQSTNWRDVGGPDAPVVAVIPAKNTAAYENFMRQAMKREDIRYDYMSYKSTGVIDLVKRLPTAISFVAQGAAAKQVNIKTLKIDGLLAMDKDYPFHQEFFFVTKGKPAGLVERFIDFAFSQKGQEIIKRKGMVPISRP
jgi:phosphate transport system substrate-binding protein